ncbi:hypothetical protein P7K49_031327, partial [Saguinus oedipus]
KRLAAKHQGTGDSRLHCSEQSPGRSTFCINQAGLAHCPDTHSSRGFFFPSSTREPPGLLSSNTSDSKRTAPSRFPTDNLSHLPT